MQFIISLIMIPILAASTLIFSYAIQNDFFPHQFFSLSLIIFPVVTLLLLAFFVILYVLNGFLKKIIISNKIRYSFYLILLLCGVITSTVVFPEKIIKHIGVGNYTGTLILKPEAAQAFSDFYKINVKSNNTVNDLHIVWSYGKRWFIRIPDENNQYRLIEINSDFVFSVLKNNSEINPSPKK